MLKNIKYDACGAVAPFQAMNQNLAATVPRNGFPDLLAIIISQGTDTIGPTRQIKRKILHKASGAALEVFGTSAAALN